jgi:3',5'-cyclic AMP phosphodiesterase CpdA
MPGEAVTILHLSDPQFGRNHLFGSSGLTVDDQHLDSLFARLHEDLRGLAESEGLRPDLAVVSGDLAEWGRPSEFEQVQEFLEQLTGALELPRRRVLVVPGNHDISRADCQAYFLQCEASEQQPVAPFWPKWKQFKGMFDRFYDGEDAIAFDVDQPWTLFELPDLRLVVAGLNSTMAESHRGEDHYGRVGEAQLRWFAERLRAFQEQGWLRVGVLHHNVVRGAVDDDENLRDADDLERILAPRLNLVLHGHTHNAKRHRLGDGLLVLSTGSAAVTRDARPAEVPNQYQLVRVTPTGSSAGPAATSPTRSAGSATPASAPTAGAGTTSRRSAWTGSTAGSRAS